MTALRLVTTAISETQTERLERLEAEREQTEQYQPPPCEQRVADVVEVRRR